MQIGPCLAAAIKTFGLDRLDAQLLLLHALGKPAGERAWLLAHDADALEENSGQRFEQLCARRAAGEPLAYLVGRREFHGLPLAIDPRVLDPRPDTETLVDWALDLLKNKIRPRVIDLGCGSGAIALAIKHARPDASVCATDAQAGALTLARTNAAALAFDVEFFQADWLVDLPDAAGASFDLIVSNPPYIAADDPHLAALAHEPRSALVAGADGLADIRKIVLQAPRRLAAGGWLLLEHGYDQAKSVRELLEARGFCGVRSRCDLAGIERASGGSRAPLP